MVKVKIYFFASIREKFGKKVLDFQVQKGSTVSQLISFGLTVPSLTVGLSPCKSNPIFPPLFIWAYALSNEIGRRQYFIYFITSLD